MRFKIDWASLIVGRKFAVFALFYFVFEGKFQVQAPAGVGVGAYIWRADFTEGLQVRRVFIWRGLFSEFYGSYIAICKRSAKEVSFEW